MTEKLRYCSDRGNQLPSRTAGSEISKCHTKIYYLRAESVTGSKLRLTAALIWVASNLDLFSLHFIHCKLIIVRVKLLKNNTAGHVLNIVNINQLKFNQNLFCNNSSLLSSNVPI